MVFPWLNIDCSVEKKTLLYKIWKTTSVWSTWESYEELKSSIIRNLLHTRVQKELYITCWDFRLLIKKYMYICTCIYINNKTLNANICMFTQISPHSFPSSKLNHLRVHSEGLAQLQLVELNGQYLLLG